MQPVWAIGLMSGTSLDGIDASAIYTDGIEIYKFGPGLTIPYLDEFREQLKNCLGIPFPTPEIIKIEEHLTRLHAQAVDKLLSRLPEEPKVIGFHGHTIYHCPPLTWQLGNGQLLSNLIRYPVVYNFRQNDCEHGGQGAPLLPVYHQALAHKLPKPLAIINIGGVANITAINDDELIAFDTGPGNALIDDTVRQEYLKPYDENGDIAATGKIHSHVIEKWMQYPYFRKAYPKSLDRDEFQKMVNSVIFDSAADKLATLTAFTSVTIAMAIQQLPFDVPMLLISGGGRKNKTMMRCLQELLPKHDIKDIDQMYWDGDQLEAQGFAYMAVRKMRELPISFPQTTGVPAPVTGGTLVLPENFTGSMA